MRSPWKAGSMSLRSRRWAAPSSSSTEWSPRMRVSTGALASPARSVSGSAVKAVLMSAGSQRKTMSPTWLKRTVKTSP